jgi:hypothetical protein
MLLVAPVITATLPPEMLIAASSSQNKHKNRGPRRDQNTGTPF